jgi:hypothetical protein
MNKNTEKDLEELIDRELRQLPPLRAPHALIGSVLRAIELKARRPWYAQPWQYWPGPLRVVSFITLALLFGALCFASWKLAHAEAVLTVSQRVSGWLSTAGTLWHAMNVVLQALAGLVQKLGTGFVVALLLAVAMAYAMCVGLGTFYVRLTLARHHE